MYTLAAADFPSTSCFCFKCLLQILVCFVFAFTQLNIPFMFPLRHPLWLTCYKNTYSSVSKCLEILLLAFCYWLLVWLFSGWRTCSVAFQCFSICWGLVAQGLFWCMFCEYSKRMCILLTPGGVFCKYQWDPTVSWCCWVLPYSHCFFPCSCFFSCLVRDDEGSTWSE